MKVQIVLLGAVLVVAACSSGGHPASSPSHSAAPVPASSSAAPVASSEAPVAYDNSQACQAFHAATTTGIPDAENTGQTTLSWLQDQTGDADPQLQTLIDDFVSAWDDPTNTDAIDKAQAAVTRYCNSHT
jgi:hypothetical protein